MLEYSYSGFGAVGSARGLGPRGRWFKSSNPDHVTAHPFDSFCRKRQKLHFTDGCSFSIRQT